MYCAHYKIHTKEHVLCHLVCENIVLHKNLLDRNKKIWYITSGVYVLLQNFDPTTVLDLDDLHAEGEIAALPVRRLKLILQRNCINYRNCIEKEELQKRVRMLWKSRVKEKGDVRWTWLSTDVLIVIVQTVQGLFTLYRWKVYFPDWLLEKIQWLQVADIDLVVISSCVHRMLHDVTSGPPTSNIGS